MAALFGAAGWGIPAASWPPLEALNIQLQAPELVLPPLNVPSKTSEVCKCECWRARLFCALLLSVQLQSAHRPVDSLHSHLRGEQLKGEE